MRWLSRLIGVLSTLVLARLLMPDDFGVAAMAAIVLGLTSTLLDLGVNVALVRNAQATPEHYHSAWTLRLLQAMAVCALLVALAPFAAGYFNDPRVTPVLVLMAFNVVISSLENIGIVSFQKEMQFGREFRFLIVNRLFAFACTVTLAFALRNYWALVIAGTLAAVFNVGHSYVAHPMRPRWSTQKMRELFAVSQWMLVQNIGGYLDMNFHRLLVGRNDGTATMGAYTLAADVAAMPSTELLQPLNRVLFPAFVAVKHDLARLRELFLVAQSLQVMVAVPAAVVLALMADDVVRVLLGAKWEAAVPFLRVLALASALQAIQASAWYVSITLGQERRCAMVSWVQLILLASWAAIPAEGPSALQIAESRVAIVAAGLGVQLWIAGSALGGVSVSGFLAGIWRTLLALAIVSVVYIKVEPTFPSGAAKLVIGGAACLALQAILTWAIWRICGRPQGAERYVADRIQSRWP